MRCERTPHVRCVTVRDTLGYIEICSDTCGCIRYGWCVLIRKGSTCHASHMQCAMVCSHICIMADAFHAVCDGTHTDIHSLIARGSACHASHVRHAMVRSRICIMADVFHTSRNGTHADIRLNVKIRVTCHVHATRNGVIMCSCCVQCVPRSM